MQTCICSSVFFRCYEESVGKVTAIFEVFQAPRQPITLRDGNFSRVEGRPSMLFPRLLHLRHCWMPVSFPEMRGSPSILEKPLRNWPNMTEASAKTKHWGFPPCAQSQHYSNKQQRDWYSDEISSSHQAPKVDNFFLQNRFLSLGRVSNNQNGNLRWFLPFRGVGVGLKGVSSATYLF